MGIVFWEILTRSDPFEEYRETEEFGKIVGERDGNSVWLYRLQEIKFAIIRNKLRPSFPKNINFDMKKLIESCWETNPKDRPSASDVVEILSKFLGVNPKINLRFNLPQNFVRNLPSSSLLSSSVGSKVNRFLNDPAFIDVKDIHPVCSLFYHGHVWIGCRDGLLSIWNVNVIFLLFLFFKFLF